MCACAQSRSTLPTTSRRQAAKVAKLIMRLQSARPISQIISIQLSRVLLTLPLISLSQSLSFAKYLQQSMENKERKVNCTVPKVVYPLYIYMYSQSIYNLKSIWFRQKYNTNREGKVLIVNCKFDSFGKSVPKKIESFPTLVYSRNYRTNISVSLGIIAVVRFAMV